MRTLLPALLVSLAFVAHRGAGDTGPPLRLTLQVGVDHAFLDGEEKLMAVAGKEVRAKITVQPNRRFDAAGLRFDFPRDMAFEYDAGQSLPSWALDGGDCTLQVFAFSAGKPAELAKSVLVRMQAMLDKDAREPKPHDLVLGGKSVSGLRCRISIGDPPSHQFHTAVGLEVGGKPVVILVQDSGPVGETASAEASHVLDLLAKTFVVTAK